MERSTMMSLMRFDPERELLSLRDAMNRLMEESFVLPSILGEVRGTGRASGLAVDMYETNDHLVVKASVPGEAGEPGYYGAGRDSDDQGRNEGRAGGEAGPLPLPGAPLWGFCSHADAALPDSKRQGNGQL